LIAISFAIIAYKFSEEQDKQSIMKESTEIIDVKNYNKKSGVRERD
jgi:hypothetical protein